MASGLGTGDLLGGLFGSLFGSHHHMHHTSNSNIETVHNVIHDPMLPIRYKIETETHGIKYNLLIILQESVKY